MKTKISSSNVERSRTSLLISKVNSGFLRFSVTPARTRGLVIAAR